MEHPQTGSLWGILYHNQVELLLLRFGHSGKKLSQAIVEVPQGKEC